MQTPILETKRLILRPFNIKDAEEIFNGWASDPEVSKYMLWSPSESLNDTIKWLKEDIQENQNDNYYNYGFIFKESGDIIGNGGLTYNTEKSMFEIFYGIKKSCWHNHFASEAVKEIIRFAEKELGAKEIYGCHAVLNPFSGSVMEKLGFKYIEPVIMTKFDGSAKFDGKGYVLKGAK